MGVSPKTRTRFSFQSFFLPALFQPRKKKGFSLQSGLEVQVFCLSKKLNKHFFFINRAFILILKK